MEQQSTNSSAGKGMMLTGLILGILCIIGYWIVGLFGVAGSILSGGNPMTICYIWVAVCLIPPILSFMGMKKAGEAGGSKTLGIAGLICGVVGLGLAAYLTYGTHAAMSMAGQLMNDVKAGADSAMNTLKSMSDSAH